MQSTTTKFCGLCCLRQPTAAGGAEARTSLTASNDHVEPDSNTFEMETKQKGTRSAAEKAGCTGYANPVFSAFRLLPAHK
jgi:hypothetical protein